MSQLLLCIETWPRSQVEKGKTYESVGRFTCPACGHISPVLLFAAPVRWWHGVRCRVCRRTWRPPGGVRPCHAKRFIPLTPPPDVPIDVTRELETC